MGNDGGSFNKVHQLKLDPFKGDNLAKDDDLKDFGSASKWEYCRLSNKRLQLPIVSDYKGSLFNKESILEWLLTPGREDYSDDQIRKFAHIRKLDDVIELRNIEERQEGESKYKQKSNCSIVCEYGEAVFGKSSVKLIYLARCGDVLPEKSLQLMAKRVCAKCDEPYGDFDIVTINPSSRDDIDRLQKRYEKLKLENKHHNGKDRKLKKRPRNESSAARNVKKSKVDMLK